jgi:hypothetical protein
MYIAFFPLLFRFEQQKKRALQLELVNKKREKKAFFIPLGTLFCLFVLLFTVDMSAYVPAPQSFFYALLLQNMRNDASSPE